MAFSRFDLAIIAVAAPTAVSSLVFVTLAAIFGRNRADTAAAGGSKDGATLVGAFAAGFKKAIADWPAYFAPMLWFYRAARCAWRDLRGLWQTPRGKWQLAYITFIITQSVAVFFLVLNG